MKKVLLGFALTLITVFSVVAQSRTVTGRVTSADEPDGVPGVNVQVKGTAAGSVTDLDGNFSVNVPSGSNTLVFSFVGYRTQEMLIDGRSILDVVMQPDISALSEVVVTAQGIERDERSLGYSLQSIKGDALSQKSEPNLLNALQGKVAGVTIGGSSGGAGTSTNINIRGITSFTGSNQPLIVVDGIIFSNDTDNTQTGVFGSQPGNRLNDIAPESIQSINILKGPAAAVLYGSRASAGAIIITTKSGRGLSDKTEITVTSSLNLQDPIDYAPLQNDYGQGTQNNFVPTTTASWGPRFGTPGFDTVVNTQGETVPYRAFPNHFREFFQTGRIFQNGINIASGNADENYVLNLSSTNQEGIIPNTGFDRYSVQVGGNKKLQNGVKVGGTMTYVKSKQRAGTAGNGGSALGQMTRIPRSFDFSGRPFQDELGRSIYYNPAQNHPLWSAENELFDLNVDRIFGNLNVGYDFTDWLNVTYRATADTYTDRRKQTLRIGAARAPQGQLDEDVLFRSELNGDLMITMRKANLFAEGINANLLLGQNINQRDFQNVGVVGESLTIPGFDNVSNASVFTNSSESKSRRRLIGYYAQLSLDYNDYLFLELSGRVDQSSTLPTTSNAYFYPSIAASFVPTDAFNIQSDILSYAKVRASAARVGRDADPYLLQSVLVSAGYGNNVASINFPISVAGGSIPGFTPAGRIGSFELTPEFVTAYEVGLNLGLFNNRFGLDLAYFNTVSTNQIFNVAVSPSTGFDTRTTNIGEMTNKGIEAVLSSTIFKRGDFTWDANLNFTRIRNEVVSIAEGVDNSGIPPGGFIGITSSIAVGQPYGVVISTAFPRNENGDLLVNPTTGAYAPGVPNSVIANVQPDWLAGLANTFTYKNLTFYALIDARYGGQLYSFNQVDLRTGGHIDYTGVDRDQPRILPGVIANGDGTYRPNNIQVPAQTYYGSLGGLASEGAVFDATVYRLREVSLSYSIPARVLRSTPFGQASFGVSARNLFFFAPGFPADPEVNTQGAGNIQGMDLSGAPQTRNYGVNLRFTL
ncbi:TonB-linked outer membrane protein, SusC/RagA family [Aquiflexum balticum DSM 16537]|uniref:TonB-linked outer membrane protein, SusC/RagA family n=1 Tax=Aquiflexum balticum DSM 16537 TaxID=758820 RepID=A0A1W2GZ29_9BACT|nr:SusC/RagA family TonB-linked outer membrane protein [Aquiflexum balticum]SMD41879.1 TonB-linked outer membrane protein, SusC/RagA family [Aquiflexum balticum DSM 16537]